LERSVDQANGSKSALWNDRILMFSSGDQTLIKITRDKSKSSTKTASSSSVADSRIAAIRTAGGVNDRCQNKKNRAIGQLWITGWMVIKPRFSLSNIGRTNGVLSIVPYIATEVLGSRGMVKRVAAGTSHRFIDIAVVPRRSFCILCCWTHSSCIAEMIRDSARIGAMLSTFRGLVLPSRRLVFLVPPPFPPPQKDKYQWHGCRFIGPILLWPYADKRWASFPN
jgi:hypothetical protein